MSQQGGAVRRAGRGSFPSRNRRRWQIVAAIVAVWIVLYLIAGSVLGATIFLLVIAAIAAAAVYGLRALGVNRDHPWVQRISSRPWRDGQDVLQQALKHLPEVFVVTPNGALMAPDVVDLRMNPDDLAVLGERMDPSVVMESAAEVYQETVAAHHARLARRAPVEVRVIADPGMPPGRFRLRQAQPVNNYAAPDGPDAHGAPEVRGAPAAHGAPEVRGAPAAHGAPEAYGAPGSHGAPGAYGFSEVHGAPEAYGAREVHGGPGAHDAPGAYGAPEVRGAPGAHGAPDAYGAPDIPRAPENPRAPQNPRLPENPRVPEN